MSSKVKIKPVKVVIAAAGCWNSTTGVPLTSVSDLAATWTSFLLSCDKVLLLVLSPLCPTSFQTFTALLVPLLLHSNR